MRIKVSEFTSSSCSSLDLPLPKPGEIWEVNRSVHSPIEFSSQEQQNLYSKDARRFLEGNSEPRYVMIVREPERAIELEQEQEWQLVSVMLLSVKTSFLSHIDLIIPSSLSGVGQDLLAQTWHILPMLTCNLSHQVAQRLSRKIYDVLLSVGDYYHGLVEQAPLPEEIDLLGLKVGTVSSEAHSKIEAFHQHEEAWSDILKIPVAAYHTYLKTMKLSDKILDEAMTVEREFTEAEREILGQLQPELDAFITSREGLRAN